MTTLRTRLAQVAVILTAPALAACSTNFGSQTDQVYIPGRGVNDRSGMVDVLNVVVVAEASGIGIVVASLVNNDREKGDTLTGVTVDGAEASISKKGADIPVAGINNLGATGAVTVSPGGEIPEGTFVEVVFTFENAEAITVEAPVVPHEAEYENIPLSDPAE
ncbi:MAG TPA: hypothetical protein VLI04_23130 [Nocardioidaceae bacterium]|nr:hypothetical protein [Nocardioidaceae bacterium]